MADKTITAVVGATGTQVENHSAEDKRIVDRVLKYNSRGAGLTVWEFTFGTGGPPHDSILVGTPPRWIVFGPCAVTHNRRTRKHVSNHR